MAILPGLGVDKNFFYVRIQQVYNGDPTVEVVTSF